jgi:large subunit ribosomal protein L13
MRTYIPKGKDVSALSQGQWLLVDANGQVLGRLASRVARLLMGKHKVRYTPSVECGDHVVVINAAKVRLTGRKLDQKMYRSHSGYPGGLKEIRARNKLHKRRAKKLRVFAGAEHTHKAQQPQTYEL